MKNTLIYALLLGCVGFVAANAYQDYAPAEFKIKTQEVANAPARICGKQVMTLPEDGQHYYTTVYGNSKTVAGWFDSDVRLKDLKRRTHFSVFPKSDPMYSRYVKHHGNSAGTVVVLQDPYGRVIYNSRKHGLPTSGSALASAIQGDITANCIFRRWRDRRDPEPEPAPEPTPDDEVVDDEEVEEAEADPVDNFPYLLAGLGLAIGLGLGVATSYTEQYYKPEA